MSRCYPRTSLSVCAYDPVINAILTTLRPHTRSPRARRWRGFVAICALVALAWPSLGPLPWLVHDSSAHHHGEFSHAVGAYDQDHHADASSIPGSPTHPIDHDCPECQVLKHLARCVLPTLAIAVLPAVFVSAVSPRIAMMLPAARPITHLPPVRAPPASIA
jgi:hypothetical protein